MSKEFLTAWIHKVTVVQTKCCWQSTHYLVCCPFGEICTRWMRIFSTVSLERSILASSPKSFSLKIPIHISTIFHWWSSVGCQVSLPRPTFNHSYSSIYLFILFLQICSVKTEPLTTGMLLNIPEGAWSGLRSIVILDYHYLRVMLIFYPNFNPLICIKRGIHLLHCR